MWGVARHWPPRGASRCLAPQSLAAAFPCSHCRCCTPSRPRPVACRLPRASTQHRRTRMNVPLCVGLDCAGGMLALGAVRAAPAPCPSGGEGSRARRWCALATRSMPRLAMVGACASCNTFIYILIVRNDPLGLISFRLGRRKYKVSSTDAQRRNEEIRGTVGFQFF
jgi:hypothetical protein